MLCGGCGKEVTRVRLTLEPERRESCRFCESHESPVSPHIKVMETKNASVTHARDIRSRRVNYEGGNSVVSRGARPLYFIPK